MLGIAALPSVAQQSVPVPSALAHAEPASPDSGQFQPVQPHSAQPVRVAGARALTDLPTLVADAKGLFARHGLEVAVSLGDIDTHRLARLQAGEVDFALLGLTPLVVDLVAHPDRGGPQDPVILAGLIHSSDIDRVVFHRARPIGKPSDLSGRRVALPPDANAEFLWWLFSTFHALAADIDLQREHSSEALLDLLAAGAIDAAVMREPWIARLRARLGADLGQFPTSHLYAAKWVLVSTRRTARERPALCAAMLASYRDAIALINQNTPEALALHAERAGLSASALEPDWRRQALDYHLSIDWSLIAALKQQAHWAALQADLADPIIDILALIDETALRSLVPGAVGIPPPLPRRP